MNKLTHHRLNYLIAAARKMFPGFKTGPTGDLNAVEAILQQRIGAMDFEGAICIGELRKAWFDLSENSGKLPGGSYEKTMSLPLAKRVILHIHPPSGLLLKPWLLTDDELRDRFTFSSLI